MDPLTRYMYFAVPYSNMKKTAIEQKPILAKTIAAGEHASVCATIATSATSVQRLIKMVCNIVPRAGMVSALQKVHQKVAEAPTGNAAGELPACLVFSRDLFVSKASRLVRRTTSRWLTYAYADPVYALLLGLKWSCGMWQDQLMTRRYLPGIAAAIAKMIQTSPVSAAGIRVMDVCVLARYASSLLYVCVSFMHDPCCAKKNNTTGGLRSVFLAACAFLLVLLKPSS